MDTSNDITTFVIFGATGDLATSKLFPALFDLFQTDELPDSFRILGVSRTSYSDKQFRNFLSDQLESEVGKPDKLSNFLSNVHFQPGDVTDLDSYNQLYERVQAFDDNFGGCANKLFYIAMSPEFFAEIGRNFANSKLMSLCKSGDSWTRILVEKPYGTDLESAEKIDNTLCEIFTSDQLFRIDHYLAKPAMRNILTLRFFNQLFSGSWNREYIDHVHIRLAESGTVGDRVGFYDHIGAFRDTGQNHVLQILAAIAMEEPASIAADAVREKRAGVLSDLRSFGQDEVADNVVFGQYNGYQKEDGVRPESQTATYFLIRSFIDNQRWRGVPFFLESGKGLNESAVTVDIAFSAPQFASDRPTGNRLRMQLQPNQELSFTVWMQEPELGHELQEDTATFTYPPISEFPSAYESILYHAIIGEHLMFAHNKEVQASWKFAMPIVRYSQNTKTSLYQIGTKGPQERRELLPD
jgi:glucose-6-phosphate 1-dehydrogenase